MTKEQIATAVQVREAMRQAAVVRERLRNEGVPAGAIPMQQAVDRLRAIAEQKCGK